ncbi:hypothetical protein ASPCADRAFT_206315 [Aspergillus carbonarius ITEM 5010]|uniref:Uncharacterized protein n=1 Tax=Aspergillus carbonarius (strain ITEM 5010) TaxID=602072 RepID=A0A1R3RSN0_ASPC5|nr:hypothetical protein ASPCADRAFT_206315 [Aspergillus carbonarius ITEM 5010]
MGSQTKSIFADLKKLPEALYVIAFLSSVLSFQHETDHAVTARFLLQQSDNKVLLTPEF